jgi:hypothetical protein
MNNGQFKGQFFKDVFSLKHRLLIFLTAFPGLTPALFGCKAADASGQAAALTGSIPLAKTCNS